MKRVSKKKTYKRKTYKRKTNRGKTNKRKTNKRKTNKRKSLKGGLRRYLRKKENDYETGRIAHDEQIYSLNNRLGNLVTLGESGTTGQKTKSAFKNSEEIEIVKGQIRDLGIERTENKIKNGILKAMVEGKSFEIYKSELRPEGDGSGLKKHWDEVVQILGNKVNDICRIVGFDESEWKILMGDSQNREANIRNILIGIDHIIQYQLDNPGASDDYLGYGMVGSFLGQ